MFHLIKSSKIKLAVCKNFKVAKILTIEPYEIVFMMGLPGAGKSYVRKNRFLNNIHVKTIDPDEIKKNHPNFNPSNPTELHEYSVNVAKREFQKAIQKGQPIILDGTGSNLKNMLKNINYAKQHGYKIKLLYVFVPIEIALYRNRKRDRFVPEDIILRKHDVIDRTFVGLKRIADEVEIVNNYTSNELKKAKENLDLYPPPLKQAPNLKESSNNIEYSFVMFKPLALKKNMVNKIKKMLKSGNANLRFDKCKVVRVSKDLITKHYAEHKKKEFFKNLVNYYVGKKVIACRVMGKKGLIRYIRRKIGNSNPIECFKEHIRNLAKPYVETGETCGVDNLIHASDSPISAKRELKIWGLLPPKNRKDKNKISTQIVLKYYKRASLNKVWKEWQLGDKKLTRDEQLALLRVMAGDILRVLRKLGVKVSYPEIQIVANGNYVIWFMPDENNLLPIYCEYGNITMYRARRASYAKEKLGNNPIDIAKNLVKLTEALSVDF